VDKLLESCGKIPVFFLVIPFAVLLLISGLSNQSCYGNDDSRGDKSRASFE